MTIGRYCEIREVLGDEWCRRAVKTGLLLVELGWMTDEEYADYWQISAYVYGAHKDDKGKTRLLADYEEE